mmetsp:Transcript_14497/g.21304  ORF Transcript_14497/g.21304 Transcript_14497/m.21304 type:complete len:245 (+) Transcript_14497:650-1384(+)
MWSLPSSQLSCPEALPRFNLAALFVQVGFIRQKGARLAPGVSGSQFLSQSGSGAFEFVDELCAHLGIPGRFGRPWVQVGQAVARVSFGKVLFVDVTRIGVRAQNRRVIAVAVDRHACGFLAKGIVDKGIDLLFVLGTNRHGHAVNPGHRTLNRGLIMHRLASSFQRQRRPIPGLTNHNAFVQQAVFLGVRIVPDQLDPVFARHAPVGDLAPDFAHFVFAAIGGPDRTGVHFARGFHVETGTQHH